MRIHNFAIVITVVALTGCANMEYPAGWSPQAKVASGCLSLAGTYRNLPSAVVPASAPPLELLRFLQSTHVFAREWQAQLPSNVQTVTIEQNDEFATIIEHRDEATRTSRLRIYDNSEYVFTKPPDGIGCNHFSWQRAGKEVGGASPVGIASESSGWIMWKADDGSIAIQLLSGTSGMILAIPFSDAKWTWYRYDPVR
jgi:hypothetical protein